MKSKNFYLFCLLLGEGLLFGAFKSWLLLAGIFLSTFGIVSFPCKAASPLPEILLKKSKIILALIFWGCFFYSLRAFVQTLSCLNCMQGIQRANARHFWDVHNPSVRTWSKNVYQAYPQPVILFSILIVLAIACVLIKRKK